MKRFDGKVALITGAASGIGRATALRLASEGAAIYCVDLQEELLNETAALVREMGEKAEVSVCNITDETQVKSAVQGCIDAFGKIDHVTNMAGILRFDHSHELSLEDFQKVMAVNVTGTFLFCREAIPHLLESKGNIVNAASTSALKGVPWAAVYSASKGAVLAMTRSLAVEYADQGLRANTVCPGNIETPMTSPTFPEGIDFDKFQRGMPLTGFSGPEVVAGVIAMLASDDGKHITGEDIRMDGGALS